MHKRNSTQYLLTVQLYCPCMFKKGLKGKNVNWLLGKECRLLTSEEAATLKEGHKRHV